MVIQVNIWHCEICYKIETTTEETSAYSDPVVTPIEGWDLVVIDGKEFEACKSCVENYKQERTRT
jgi:hypothetical protein